MAERNIRLVVEYDGTAYAGWQVQPGQRTIQGQVCEAVRKVTGREINLLAAGRTDGGVHARGQVASFHIDSDLPTERFAPAINHYLDDDILVHEASEAPLDFNPRYDAKSKRYRYLISSRASAIYRHQRWHCPHRLELGRLREAAAMVIGEHDFAPFCVVASRKPNNRCRIENSTWRRVGDLLVYEIRGNRFLHGMVRSLVGAMVNLARTEPDDNALNLTLNSFRDIIQTPSDERVVFTAPAHGLYLVSVQY